MAQSRKRKGNLSDEELIELYNSKQFTMKEIGQNFDLSESTINTRICRLRKKGLVGKKIKSGPPVEVTAKTEEKPKEGSLAASLGSLLEDMANAEPNEEISIAHKEMLIEILHRIIVK